MFSKRYTCEIKTSTPGCRRRRGFPNRSAYMAHHLVFGVKWSKWCKTEVLCLTFDYLVSVGVIEIYLGFCNLTQFNELFVSIISRIFRLGGHLAWNSKTLSARALTLKSDWAGNDFAVARRFEILANHWAENTIEIRLQLVRATANFLHPLQIAKCDKKITVPTCMEGDENNLK